MIKFEISACTVPDVNSGGNSCRTTPETAVPVPILKSIDCSIFGKRELQTGMLNGGVQRNSKGLDQRKWEPYVIIVQVLQLICFFILYFERNSEPQLPVRSYDEAIICGPLT